MVELIYIVLWSKKALKVSAIVFIICTMYTLNGQSFAQADDYQGGLGSFNATVALRLKDALEQHKNYSVLDNYKFKEAQVRELYSSKDFEKLFPVGFPRQMGDDQMTLPVFGSKALKKYVGPCWYGCDDTIDVLLNKNLTLNVDAPNNSKKKNDAKNTVNQKVSSVEPQVSSKTLERFWQAKIKIASNFAEHQKSINELQIEIIREQKEWSLWILAIISIICLTALIVAGYEIVYSVFLPQKRLRTVLMHFKENGASDEVMLEFLKGSDGKDNASSLKLSATSAQITTAATGLILFTLALGFFFLYLIYVYRLEAMSIG